MGGGDGNDCDYAPCSTMQGMLRPLV